MRDERIKAHESFKTTAESYAQRDAVASAQQTGARGARKREETRLLNHPLNGQSFPNRSLNVSQDRRPTNNTESIRGAERDRTVGFLS